MHFPSNMVPILIFQIFIWLEGWLSLGYFCNCFDLDFALYVFTRRYSLLGGLTSSSCGGLWPLAKAFSLSLYHDSKSIPWVQVNTMNPFPMLSLNYGWTWIIGELLMNSPQTWWRRGGGQARFSNWIVLSLKTYLCRVMKVFHLLWNIIRL